MPQAAGAPTHRHSRRSCEMKRLAKEFRVHPGEAVDLTRRPTLVKPVYESKQEYKQLLDEHVARLSALRGGVSPLEARPLCAG